MSSPISRGPYTRHDRRLERRRWRLFLLACIGFVVGVLGALYWLVGKLGPM